MQYILTQDEYNHLVPVTILMHERDKVEILNKQVLELTKYKCIYDNEKIFSYCDDCPITKTCNKSHHYSK